MPKVVHPIISANFEENGITQTLSKRTKRRCRGCKAVLDSHQMEHLASCQNTDISVRDQAQKYLKNIELDREMKMNQIHSEKSKQNKQEFLENVSSLWSRLEDGFPTASYGFQVLNSLREVEFDIHQPTSILDGWENSTWPKTPPTFVDIMMDTASAKKVEDITFFDTFSGTLEAQIEGETEEAFLIRARAQHMAGLLGFNGTLPALNAISIFGRTNRGIHRHSHLFSLPEEFKISAYATTSVQEMSERRDGEKFFDAPKFNSICSPSGAITQPHVDGISSASFQVHISGTKLWFFWPPNAHNLLWLSEHNDDSRPPDLLNAISRLKNLTLMLLTPGNRMTMDPGTIHSVMSLNTSAHTSLEFFSEVHFDLAKKNMEWELEWLSGMERSGRGMLESRIIHSLDGLKMWEKVASQRQGHQPRNRKQSKMRRIDGMTSDVEDIIGRYNELLNQ